jgi:hypothetical protein
MILIADWLAITISDLEHNMTPKSGMGQQSYWFAGLKDDVENVGALYWQRHEVVYPKR